jgi:hypothetical protein
MERDSAPLQSVFIRETTALPSPDKVVDAVLCYQPDVPLCGRLCRRMKRSGESYDYQSKGGLN